MQRLTARYFTRRQFIQSSVATTAMLLSSPLRGLNMIRNKRVLVGAHLWVYASKYPPNYDCTEVLGQVFSDIKYAGIDVLELMHQNVLHENSVERLTALVEKYKLPIIGSSFGAQMWDRDRVNKVLEDAHVLFERLEGLNAKYVGLSVGHPRRKKTIEELETQVELLKKILILGKKHKITCNLHNHTYEVQDDFYDLNFTLKNIPDFPLGPDLNWLIRAGADPVKFIRKYQRQIVYLHIRDQYQSGEWSEAVGEGDTDFENINTALHDIKFSGVATIELAFPDRFTPTRSMRENWKMSRDYVREVFGW